VRDLRKYWQEVRAIQRDLPDFVWIVGTAGAGPQRTLRLVEVLAEQAAKMLHGGSHRLATEEEVEAHKAAEDSLRQKAFRDDLRRRGVAVVTVTPGAKKR
jgi:sugar/nucleoside kinase (ribokinase family)